MTNEVIETILRRRSVRSYKPEQISDGELSAVLEAGCSAPYAGAPVHITVIQSAELAEKINRVAKQAALGMGIPHLAMLGSDPDFMGSYGAPTLIFLSDSEDSVSPDLNCGAAAQSILIAAESLGLGGCWVHFPLFSMYGPQAGEIRSDMQLAAGLSPRACVALGYRAEGEATEREYSEVTRIK